MSSSQVARQSIKSPYSWLDFRLAAFAVISSASDCFHSYKNCRGATEGDRDSMGIRERDSMGSSTSTAVYRYRDSQACRSRIVHSMLYAEYFLTAPQPLQCNVTGHVRHVSTASVSNESRDQCRELTLCPDGSDGRVDLAKSLLHMKPVQVYLELPLLVSVAAPPQ